MTTHSLLACWFSRALKGGQGTGLGDTKVAFFLVAGTGDAKQIHRFRNSAYGKFGRRILAYRGRVQ